MMSTHHSNAEIVAEAFTSARHSGLGVDFYPGERPQTLEEAYQIQDLAISKWPHQLVGWKVGGIGPQDAVTLGEAKLAGPVFDNKVFKSNGRRIDMPVFAEGFAAVEAEIIMVISKDAPADKVNWTIDEAREYVGAVHIGVEIASSPFAQINEMGPLVTISDFGNNNGLILGEKLPDWENSALEDWTVETIIDEQSKGVTTPPQPLESVRFILGNAAKRGRPLKKGMIITTGAITGVHQAYSGQRSTIKCSRAADIDIVLSSHENTAT